MAEKSFGNASGSIKRVYYAVTAISGVPGWPGVRRLLSAEGVCERGGVILLLSILMSNKQTFDWRLCDLDSINTFQLRRFSEN